MDIKLVKLKSQLVLGIREQGPYNKIMETVGKLAKYAASRGVKITGNPIFISHEGAKAPSTSANIDLEVVVPVKEKTSPDEESMELGIISYAIAGGDFVEAIHKDPHQALQESYKELFLWIKDNGYIIVGPIREVYLDDQREANAAEVRTEIYVPVQKGREDKQLLKEEPQTRPEAKKKRSNKKTKRGKR